MITVNLEKQTDSPNRGYWVFDLDESDMPRFTYPKELHEKEITKEFLDNLLESIKQKGFLLLDINGMLILPL